MCMYEGTFVGMFVVIYILHVCLYRIRHLYAFMYACMYEGMYVDMFVVMYILRVCLYAMRHVDMMLSSQTCPSKQRSNARKEISRKKTSKNQITAQNVLDSVAGRPRFLV